MNHHRYPTFSSVVSALLACASLCALGCHAASTDVQVRDAADQSPIVGQTVGTPGPLHAGNRWRITDTDGVAHLRTKRDWDELRVVVATPDRRPMAEGVLKPGSRQWVALSPAPQPLGRRLEARVVSGEGAPGGSESQP